MKSSTHRLGSVVLGLLLSSCGMDRSAGNSVETESDVAARLLEVDSLLPEWNRPDGGLTVATLRLNRENFDFSRSKPDGRDVRLERQDSSLLPFEIVYWDLAARMGRLHVRLDSALLSRDAKIRVRWGGTPATSPMDPVRTWEGIPESRKLDLNSHLVADFESGGDTTLLPTRSLWKSHGMDSANVIGMTFVPAEKGRAGKALNLLYSTVNTNSYAVVNTALIRGTTEPRSLRSLDSVVFWARGNGVLRFAFDRVQGDRWPKAWTTRTLDTNWVRYRIRPMDLDTPSVIGNIVGWEGVRDSVTHLTFIAAKGSEVWIDDVRLHGVNRDDLR
jgi:hypothetical protein